jgi:Concanavalin A-like lectin/glucanases superfamily/Secretion system C-terminal sorting domain
MKKTLYVFVWACSALLALPAAAQVPAYVPTDGLVGWWPFNGNANDESGNGNDGVVNGATLTEDRFGNVNNAYNFQSANSNYISINNNPVQNGTASISGWFNPTAPIGGPIIHIGSDNSTAANCNGYFFGFGTIANPTGNNLLLDASCQGNYNTEWIATPNTWYHFTLIRTQNNLTAYINGNMVGSYTPTGIISPSNNIFFGSTFSSNSVFYNGIIDDIAIYNRALTEQEIQNLYTGTTPEPCAALPSNLQQGLVGYWPFCGNANDESGNGNDGTVNGATLTEDRFGNAGSAYDFDGSNYIAIVNSSDFHFGIDSSFSTNLWFKRNLNNQNWMVMLSYACGDANFGGGYQLGLDPDINLELGDSPDDVFQNNNGNDTLWHMLATVIDRISDSAEIYLDGNFIGTKSISSDYSYTPTCLPEILFGGERNYWQQYFFNGSLDDIAIYNHALTPEEVQELYTLDACTFTVYDTLTVYETVYDTVYTYETIYDTVTTYVTVTDTLLIDITFTGFEGQPSWLNTVTVFPNPASDHITIDYGNFALMASYNTIITDAAGATVYSSAVNSQQAYIDINGWGAAGVYYLTIYDASGAAVAVRHIVLE